MGRTACTEPQCLYKGALLPLLKGQEWRQKFNPHIYDEHDSNDDNECDIISIYLFNINKLNK